VTATKYGCLPVVQRANGPCVRTQGCGSRQSRRYQEVVGERAGQEPHQPANYQQSGVKDATSPTTRLHSNTRLVHWRWDFAQQWQAVGRRDAGDRRERIRHPCLAIRT